MRNETPEKNTNNILGKILQKMRSIFSKKKMIPEPQVVHYDEGVNIVVMKQSNFENLKENVEKMNKKVKLDNGFISVNDLSDEEIEEMIQIYNDELIEVNKRINTKKLELERLRAK
ncbi:MAG: hypothetical protein HFJ18_01315 [Clostridia bacterium]|nr:hypothetical protein [Clostridia bacterium]